MTNEPIIDVKLKKFRDSYGLISMSDGDVFERFVNSSILSQHQPDAFTADSELLEKVCVGGQNDTGIDGVAIKVNGVLVRDIQECTDVISKVKRITIEFIFIQSKYKPNFDAKELNGFIAGVRNFLSNSPNLPANERVLEWLKVKDYLLSDEIVFHWDANPSVRMYYVAMGKWRSHQHHLALADTAKKDVMTLKTYEKVDVHFIDSESLRNILDSIENNFSEILETIGVLELTSVQDVDNSCIALFSADEFSKLLTTEEGFIRKSLFEDNVRDYQGESTINNEIFDTIKTEPEKFILLNNGVTIVCDSFTSNNRKLKIVNPQIVNGCQTSHAIYFAKKAGLSVSKVPLSVKIISTKDQEISNEIVRGTNRQNIVLDEAFEATKKFHKDLEAFFNSFGMDLKDKIYYERRAKQYASSHFIKQVQKINLRILTQYFVGMFLNRPHVSHRHESVLLREFSDIIFQEGQSKLPYFVASLAFYKLEALFREAKFYPNLKPFKPHLLMVFREAVAGAAPSLFSEKQIDEYSLKILDFLKDQQKTVTKFEETANIFNSVIAKWTGQMMKSRFAMKDVSDFTNLLIDETSKFYSKPVRNIREEPRVFRGVVIKTMRDKNGNHCGFIKRFPENIFFHAKQNRELNFAGLESRVVTYKTTTNNLNGLPLAVNIEIVESN